MILSGTHQHSFLPENNTEKFTFRLPKVLQTIGLTRESFNSIIRIIKIISGLFLIFNTKS